MKAGFVSVLGRPNVGKSTLVNALLSRRVSIVSPKAQTTRDDIMGIYNAKDLQIAFIDTPGLFSGGETLYRRMNRSARRSLSGVDAVLFLIDASNRDLENDISLLASIKVDAPIFIVLNKIDLARAPVPRSSSARPLPISVSPTSFPPLPKRFPKAFPSSPRDSSPTATKASSRKRRSGNTFCGFCMKKFLMKQRLQLNI